MYVAGFRTLSLNSYTEKLRGPTMQEYPRQMTPRQSLSP